RPVGSEVEEDRAVTRRIESRSTGDDDGLDELIRNASLITTPNGLDWILALLADTVDDRVERALRTLPALVTVHGVVPAGDGADAVGRQLGEVVDGRVRRHVATVRERVDPGLLRRELQQRLHVVEVGVDAAV